MRFLLCLAPFRLSPVGVLLLLKWWCNRRIKRRGLGRRLLLLWMTGSGTAGWRWIASGKQDSYHNYKGDEKQYAEDSKDGASTN